MGQVNENNAWYRVGVKALVINKGRLLFVKEGSDLWDLPGGGLEHDEDVHSAMSREMHEELGVKISQQSKLPVAIWKSYDPVNKRPVLVLCYEVRLQSDKFQIKQPVNEVNYLDVNFLTESRMEPYLRQFLKELRVLAATT